MLNFLYEKYPYGNAEAFVEYEMRALDGVEDTECQVYSFSLNVDGKKRFVPDGTDIVSVYDRSYLSMYVFAFFSMFSAETLSEIKTVFSEKQVEGKLRCIWRIYRYQLSAAHFLAVYKKSHVLQMDEKKNIFISYWLNQCAFALTKLKQKYPEIRIVSRGHGYDVYKERGYLPFRKVILSELDKIYLINQNGRDYFAEQYGDWLDMSKVEIAHLGVRIPTASNVVEKDGVFRIVSCASIIPLKRLDLMIDALASLNGLNVEWIHFGDGPLGESMRQYAAERLGASSVRFVFMGQKDLDEIQAYYASAPIHLFVNCSDTEGTPVSVMEAMSYGIPAIGRNVGGVGELIDADCGQLIPADASVENLAEAIMSFIKMSDIEYAQKRKTAREKILSAFNADTVYRDYIDRLNSLM